jgi:hypothetical protein
LQKGGAGGNGCPLFPLLSRGNLAAMIAIQRANIEVTTENLWFLKRYLNIFEFAEMFPEDAFAEDGREVKPVTFYADSGFRFDSVIDRSKMQLRNRSKHYGWMRWVADVSLKEGDRIVIERIGERDYHLSREEPS